MKKIAIIGTNGIPSKYGGFETLVEYLAQHLSSEYEMTIFCSSKNTSTELEEYKGCKLVYVSLSANGWQSILFDIVSLLKSYKVFDRVLILGASGCIVLPLFNKYRDKFVFNFGGLDWKRSKWGFFTRKFLKLSESMGIKYSKYLIADNIGIQKYISAEYNRHSALITYGGDQVFRVLPDIADFEKYPFLKKSYAFSVARIQSDNNIEILLNSFNEASPFPFVLVGNWGNSVFGKTTKNKYLGSNNIILLDAIYDQRELNLLRSNCKVYLHGHSAGGTNPALVEAMNLSLPIFAFDSIFNKHTTNFEAEYFSTSSELAIKLKTILDDNLVLIAKKMYAIAEKSYQWEFIAHEYSKIFNK